MPGHHHCHDLDDVDDCDDHDHEEVISVCGKYLQYAELQSECRLHAESRVYAENQNKSDQFIKLNI